MSSTLERDVLTHSDIILGQWHKIVQQVQEKQQEQEKHGVMKRSPLGSCLPARVVIPGIIPQQAKVATNVSQQSQSLDKWKNVLIVIAIALVAFAMFGAWLLSPTTLLVGAIILTLTSPNLIVALVLLGITSSKAKKTKEKYRKLVEELASKHMQAVRNLIPKIVGPGGLTGRLTVVIKEQIDKVKIWQEMQKGEVQDVQGHKLRFKLIQHWGEIQRQARHSTFPPVPAALIESEKKRAATHIR